MAITAAWTAISISADQGMKANKQAKKGMKQAENQFNEQAEMDTTRMNNEMEVANQNIANQRAALDQQWAALSAQTAASNKAQALAEQNSRDADIANNKATRKSPNVGAMLTANDKAGAAGGASTLLTGPGGAGTGTLGKSTALGS